jgi:ferredoxin
MIMTEMPLEPDPVMKPGTLCNRCMACVRECPGGAISETETVKVRLAGNDVEWGKLDVNKCSYAFRGAEKVADGERGTFLPPELSKSLAGREDAFKPSSLNPFYKKQTMQFTHGEAICAGKGCMRACMINLEKRGVLKNRFKEPFRTGSLWSIDWSDYDPDHMDR